MNELLRKILAKKLQLDKFRPFPEPLQKDIEDWLRIDLTYHSNAIEGNTLSRVETMLIVEKGLTAEGKTLIEHYEAINHAKAFDYIVGLINDQVEISIKQLMLDVHTIILDKIYDQYKGRFRDVPARIKYSPAILANPIKIPDEIERYCQKLNEIISLSAPEQACFAHFELVKIHPFIDGNGRTARLLADYILMKNGFAPAIIKKEERKSYIEAVEEYHVIGKSEKYHAYMYKAIERGLDEYLNLIKSPQSNTNIRLLKIGELARLSQVTIPTIRHWTKEGLLDVADYSPGGYQLYNESMTDRVKRIKDLQESGLSLDKIKIQLLTSQF